jgi:hypothetical protein
MLKCMTEKQVCDMVGDYPDELLLADGFNDCIVGMCECIGRENVVAYSTAAIINKLMSVEGGSLTYEDAREHFNFNIAGSYIGELTPVFITTPHDYEEVELVGQA